MHQTTYHRATSVDDAVNVAQSADDPRYLSGGMTLLPTMKQRLAAPSDLIDLRHVESMKGISEEGDMIVIGGATCHNDIATSELLQTKVPGLAYQASHIGDPMVRHMGTIGGSVANNDPAACYPSAMMAVNAVIRTNKRELAAEDFFTGLFDTALDDDEIVTAVAFRAPEKSGYGKFPNPASRYAMAGVFVAKTADGVRVAVTGAGEDGVFRASGLEEALNGDFSVEALQGKTVESSDLMGDIHASPEYRAALIVAMAKRAVVLANGGDPDTKAATPAGTAAV
ncbi:FAD binding domain-containing protein [Notoacmeibacter ruber]|uniref:Xanthine dehydrogenase family protein subunit M n=1 Tax=Notoacmeibacter ruber TaxID=2670375 RepID=A0A3L7JH46_9HYPH|nr:xanthine dehydrogenase family protein subunit M [Notoacmeibacter ruber]RLQ89489.1 xanthine dehydrogenase family protein subunit M [Notoacmeibacter ruber]